MQCSRLPQPQQGASGCPGHTSTVPQASQPGLTPVQIQSGEPLPRHPLSLSNWPMSQLIPSSSPSEMGQVPIASCPAAPCPTCPSSQRSISDRSPSPQAAHPPLCSTRSESAPQATQNPSLSPWDPTSGCAWLKGVTEPGERQGWLKTLKLAGPIPLQCSWDPQALCALRAPHRSWHH